MFAALTKASGPGKDFFEKIFDGQKFVCSPCRHPLSLSAYPCSFSVNSTAKSFGVIQVSLCPCIEASLGCRGSVVLSSDFLVVHKERQYFSTGNRLHRIEYGVTPTMHINECYG
jgi:hypothetical protein